MEHLKKHLLLPHYAEWIDLTDWYSFEVDEVNLKNLLNFINQYILDRIKKGEIE